MLKFAKIVYQHTNKNKGLKIKKIDINFDKSTI